MTPRRSAVAVAAAFVSAAALSQETQLPQVDVRADATAAPAYTVPRVVSATRTETPQIDIPQTVNAVDQLLIRDQRAIRLQDALRNVPGVHAAGGEGRRDQFTIRGFSAELDMYVDGVREPAFYRDFSNIERVEVLKGPAAMLFGRGSAGGIINRVSKKPSAEAVREVQATLGSENFRRAEWDLGGALAAGANFRLTGAVEKGGQFRDHLENDLSTVAGGVEFKLAPATRMLAQLEWQQHKSTPDRGVPSLDGLPAPVPVSNFYGEAFDYSKRKVLAGGLTLDHAFAPETTLKLSLRANTMDLAAVNTRSTGLAAGNTQVARNTTSFPKDRQYVFGQAELTHKLRLGGSEHLLLAGYERGQQKGHLQVWQVAAPNIALDNPSYVAPQPVFTDASKTFDTRFTGITDAVYLQDQISFSPRWKALLGARHDSFDQHQDAGLANKLQVAAMDRRDKAWSPRAGLVYQPAAGTAWYVSGARSFQPKADDLLFSKVADTNLAPTESTQYEIGNKNEFLGGRLAVNAALYQIAMSNVATADPANPGQTIQVGEQVHRGVEIDAAGEPAAGWRVYGGVTWIDPRVTKSNDTPSTLGHRPANVPRQAANLWLGRDLPSGWRVGFGLYYMGERYAAIDNTVRLPAYTRLDAALSYAVKGVELALNLRNLANKRYYESATNNVQIAPGAPRSLMLTARYAF